MIAAIGRRSGFAYAMYTQKIDIHMYGYLNHSTKRASNRICVICLLLYCSLLVYKCKYQEYQSYYVYPNSDDWEEVPHEAVGEYLYHMFMDYIFRGGYELLILSISV